MACVSDIDLATLHRNRLEERVHYKLSWWARRMISNTIKKRTDDPHRRATANGNNAFSTRKATDVTAAPRSEGHQATAPHHRNGLPPVSPVARGRRHADRHRDIVRNNEKELLYAAEAEEDTDANKHDLRLGGDNGRYKDDYFTTERRWRSGTWP